MAKATERTVDKLYEQLPPTKQATLVFEACARGDKTLADYVESCVEMKLYKCQDINYRRHLYQLDAMQNLFSVTYWQIRSALLQSLGMLALNESDNELADIVNRNRTCWLALSDALDKVCEERRIDVDSVRAIHNCEKVIFLEFKPDDIQLSEFKANFVEMLEKPFDL